jgi:hypothetical protein
LDKSEARRATRNTVIEKIKVDHSKRGEFGFPPAHLIQGNEEASEAWRVFITTRAGLQPPSVSIMHFTDKGELDSFLSDHLEGQELEDREKTKDFDKWQKDCARILISPNSLMLGLAIGDAEQSLASDVLGDAGIYACRYGPLSKEVKESLGPERIDELETSFGENWTIAAAFEYCWLHLPHSSPAFVAAAHRFHYYISNDDLSAGYYWRDLEVLVHGVEQTAKKAIDRSKKAGQSGSKKSTQARNLRRISFMSALEEVLQRNPDIAKLGEVPIAQLALSEAIRRDTALWSQGQGQVREYLGEIRRGEAGADLKKRYVALFGSNPLRR